MEERFWSKVDKKGDNECWNWKSCNDGRYGIFRNNNKNNGSHRLAYELHNKIDIPKGLVIRHKCDNRLCCNPNHLELGTYKDNSNDMIERNRSAFGERNPKSKLTEQQVIEIKQKLLNWKWGMDSQIAREYKVAKETIYDIRNQKTWKRIKLDV